MDEDNVKRLLQSFFTQTPLVIIGSGLSLGEGVSGMWQLSQHLKVKIPNLVSGVELDEWLGIELDIDAGVMFEDAMSKLNQNSMLVPHIINETASLLCEDERKIFKDVLTRKKVLQLESLIKHLSHNQNEIIFVTPNYDRLIELACEMRGVEILTGFNGVYYSPHNPVDEKDKVTVIEQRKTHGARPAVSVKKKLHAHVLKPHGGLDWYEDNGRVFKSQVKIAAKRLMITPGTSKFRAGYQHPFDYHRERANAFIKSAQSILIIGYGFNDEQLETHLKNRLITGTKALLITKDISPNAEKLCRGMSNVMTISALQGDDSKTVVCIDNTETVHDGMWWVLGIFIKEVLE
ncbi:SIR2 family protein [Aeromonas sp. 1HA1]|uniref:SIR2 family protein n=1 Tax=Aeromonas sp. 1HA1 TaxID=2699193 RepID=UPI0023DE0B0C|nr:SIR2 family protein [Aeromonas sp. 1HA1]MDF2414273.1 SIR2 family protein [Aeromonas sp. 1HA1]